MCLKMCRLNGYRQNIQDKVFDVRGFLTDVYIRTPVVRNVVVDGIYVFVFNRDIYNKII